MLQRPLYPTHWVLKPPPLHHIIPTPVPRLSSLASPRRCLCLTTRKPRHDAILPRYARPATMPTRHAQAPPWRHLNTERKTPTPPTRHVQAPPWRHPNTERKAPPPPTSRDANTACRTPPPRR